MSPAVELASTMWSIVRSIILKKKIKKCTPQGPITLGMQEIGSSNDLYQEPWILPRGCDENRPVSLFVCGSPVSDNLTL